MRGDVGIAHTHIYILIQNKLFLFLHFVIVYSSVHHEHQEI